VLVSSNRIHDFCAALPANVHLFCGAEMAGLFYAEQITRDLGKYMFLTESRKDDPLDPLALDLWFSGVTQSLWTIFAHLGASLTRQMFRCRLAESLERDEDAAFHAQVIGAMAPRRGKDARQQPLERQLMHFVARIGEVFEKFIGGVGENAVYLPTLRGFWSTVDQDPPLPTWFSLRAMTYLVRNLGIHAATHIDRLLLQHLAPAMLSFFREFPSQKMLPLWLSNFFERDQLPPDSVNGRGFAASCQEFLRLGVILELRALVRTAVRKVTDDSIPGCRDIVKAAVLRREGPPSEVEMLFVELADLVPNDFTLISRILAMVQGQAEQTNLNAFMFFIALHFNHSRWDDTKYMPEFDAFTGNLHLFPIATSAFLQCLDVLFERSVLTEGKKGEALTIFFATMAQIVAVRRAKNLASSANALTILADIYARRTGFEYGKIEQSFPSRIVNAAYSAGARGTPAKGK
jgi:hypothetical protein